MSHLSFLAWDICTSIDTIPMPVLLALFVQLIGFYILYSISARAVFRRGAHHLFLKQHPVFSRIMGGGLLLASLVLLMLNVGIGVGVLFALISLMAFSGCIIILFPLLKR